MFTLLFATTMVVFEAHLEMDTMKNMSYGKWLIIHV